MLIACAKCSTHYANELSTCPGCGSTNEETSEQRFAEAERKLFAQITSGEVVDLAPNWLRNDPELTADEINRLMARGLARLPGLSRDQGLRFVTKGIIFVLSPLVLMFVPFGLVVFTPIAVAIGAGMIFIGLVKVVTGWSFGNNWTWFGTQKNVLT